MDSVYLRVQAYKSLGHYPHLSPFTAQLTHITFFYDECYGIYADNVICTKKGM